ncbi:MAG: glycosyltransferase family 2 protein, partial [Atopobiaceae bacterium]|nr:glycosyltransferase family 2 protein [Atopobiaceae bacterium]
MSLCRLKESGRALSSSPENAPKVSVVVPVYGVEAYIGECIESLKGQTFADLEFIFVDDCTPDASMDAVE